MRTEFNGAIGFPVVLAACWWVRSRRFLWFVTILAIVLTLGVEIYEPSEPRATLNRTLTIAALLVTASVFHYLIGARLAIEQAAGELESRDARLQSAASEMRTQTEAIEQQSEQLRLANDELARREQRLESLLRLSRALTADQSRADTLDRICQALAEMIGAPETAVGIKMLEGNVQRLVCHYGFGPGGARSNTLPFETSFARLVLERNQTGYIQDMDLRPDLVIPQPKEGEPFHSILSAPLRVNGHAIGTLEVYSRQRRTWTNEQIGIVESLAAQTSISLQAAELFERVEHERRRFEAIFRTLPIGISVVDAATEQIQNNPAAVVLLGVSPVMRISERQQVAGLRASRGGVPLDPDQLPIFRALAGEEVQGEEIDLFAPGGRRVVVLASAAPVRSSDQQIEGAVCAWADITALKRLQSQLDSQRRAAEETSVRKSRFLAQVSHDIRTPVNAISLLAELIYRAASEPAMASEVPQIAQDLRRNATALVELVSDVLDLTRFDSGRIELEETEFCLNDMFSDECRLYENLAVEKGLEFHCELPPQPIIVRTDRIKLSRILGNLLGNAMKFTDKGSIRASIGQSDREGQQGQVWIRVVDTGPGIPREFQERIFDEFFQLRHNGNRHGAGLGLAICKRLIDAMGGTIRVESEPGNGSTFIVTLPAAGVAVAAR